jgi:hypothetical protein
MSLRNGAAGRTRARGVVASLVLTALVAAACSGGDGDDPPSTPAPTTAAATTTTVFGSEAADALLADRDLPADWEPRELLETGDLARTCPDVAAQVAAAGDGPAPQTAQRAARAPAVGLPAVRHEVALYGDVSSARDAFDVRSSGELALCLAAVGIETLEGEDAALSGRGFRAADPGPLGEEARSWILSFTVEEQGVRLDGTFEITTFRVGPIVSTLLITTSPLFALTREQRADLLAAAVARATRVVDDLAA